jgi:hypothetical protein
MFVLPGSLLNLALAMILIGSRLVVVLTRHASQRYEPDFILFPQEQRA